MLLSLVLVGATLITWVAIQNRLVNRRNEYRRAVAGLEVQYQKRRDLIPNLVDIAVKYAEHERELLTGLRQLQSEAGGRGENRLQRSKFEQRLSVTLREALARVRDNPKLGSSDLFLNLQRNLTEVEEQISAARRNKNTAVKRLNSSVQQFPGSIVAGLIGVGAVEEDDILPELPRSESEPLFGLVDDHAEAESPSRDRRRVR